MATVRARGAEIAGGRTDWFAALTPVLVGATAALLVLRLLPVPVRAAARVAARRPGLVGFLGLARAARTGTVVVLPVLAVVVGATVLSLFATLTVAIGDQRELASYRSVGADVRVDGVRVDADDAAALAARPGVHAVVRAYVSAGAHLVSGRRSTPVVVVGADPAAYAGLLRGTPLQLGRARHRVGPSSSARARRRGTSSSRWAGRGCRWTGSPSTPRSSGCPRGQDLPVVLVPLDRLEEILPSAQPNTAFLSADASAAAGPAEPCRDPATATPSGRVTGVDTAAAAEDRVAARALPRLLARTYLTGALLAGVLTLLAVVLLLVATRPERTALVIRLRTMGLPHGGERALAWAEVLPVVAGAAVAGAVVGAVAPALIEAAVDLGPFTGGAPHPALALDPLAAAAAGVLVIVLGALALVLDAAAARRSDLADHLRRGDSA